MERAQWNAFKKEARARDPLGSKLDYRNYKFLRAAYLSQSEGHPTLDPWLVAPPRNGQSGQLLDGHRERVHSPSGQLHTPAPHRPLPMAGYGMGRDDEEGV